jgi:tol-pal system protein YbgF
MIMRRGDSILALGFFLLAHGCVTSGEGDKMRADISQLRDRIDAMDRRDVEINEQVARLRKVLDEATLLLGRNSADLGTKVAKNEAEMAVLTGQIEEAKHVIDDLQKKVNDSQARLGALQTTQDKIVETVAPSIPDDKETLWREAQARLTSGRRDDARRFFRSFLQRFPQDPRAPQAQIFLGQSFAVEGKHTQAVGEYVKVIDAYPGKPEAPEAMWLLAQSYVELHFCSDAKQILQDLTRRYPKSSRVADVKVKLRELQRIAKDKRLCSS